MPLDCKTVNGATDVPTDVGRRDNDHLERNDRRIGTSSPGKDCRVADATPVNHDLLLGRLPGVGDGQRNRACELLARFDLTGRQRHQPSELSTGEKQRVALARALLAKPSIILADEPTGNLDAENAAQVLTYLSEYHREGATVVVVTHDVAVDRHADRILCLQRGRLTPDASAS